MDVRTQGRAVVVAAVGWILSAGSLAAQEPADTLQPDTLQVGDSLSSQRLQFVLEPIVVVAPRERASAPPVATIEVAPREIRGTASENPYDLIRRVTGLEVHDQGQGPGFASNVVLRGFTADHSSDLLLVVDGVPVNLPVHGHVEGDVILPELSDRHWKLIDSHHRHADERNQFPLTFQQFERRSPHKHPI